MQQNAKKSLRRLKKTNNTMTQNSRMVGNNLRKKRTIKLNRKALRSIISKKEKDTMLKLKTRKKTVKWEDFLKEEQQRKEETTGKISTVILVSKLDARIKISISNEK